MDKNEEKRQPIEASRQLLALLTVRDVSRLLRLSESKVYMMLEDRCPGGIPIKRFGRALRFSASELRRWIDEQH